MCGRFAFYSPREAVARLFGVADAPELEPRYNIAPTQFVAAVREAGGPRGVAMLHWGLVPFWAKERAIGARMINARAETLGEKPSFRHAFQRRRCLRARRRLLRVAALGRGEAAVLHRVRGRTAVRHGGPVGALARSGDRRDARVLLHRHDLAVGRRRARARPHARDRAAGPLRRVARPCATRRPPGSRTCSCPANCRVSRPGR